MNKAKKTFITALIGTILVAICCFTPILIIILSAVGLSMFVSYLDVILFPALIILIIITVKSYRKWQHKR